MKTCVSFLIFLLTAVPALARFMPEVELLQNNQIRVADGPLGGNGAAVTLRVSGIQPGQTLVAIARQPSTGVLYGLGYSASEQTANLYTLNERRGSATAVRHNGIYGVRLRVDRGVRMGFPADDRTLIVADGEGNNYSFNADNGAVETAEAFISPPVQSYPGDGIQTIADGTLRVNGVIRNDASYPEASLTGSRSSEHGFSGPGTRAVLYPNPATSQTRLALGGIAQAPVTVELVDMNGRLAQRTVYPAGREVLLLDVSGIPAGIYAARVFEGGLMTMSVELVRREP